MGGIGQLAGDNGRKRWPYALKYSNEPESVTRGDGESPGWARPGARAAANESRPGANPGPTLASVSPGGFPTPPRTGASVMNT